MPIAVSLATRSGLSATAIGALAREAERSGLDTFYLAESAADSFSLAQAALASTSSIAVGTAVANARLRHPAAAAMATATMDELSGGRFRVGLGVSNAMFNEMQLGMAPVAPVGFMREYVATMRRLLSGTSDDPGAPADTPRFRSDRPPVRPIPITIAALQPRMLRLAGEVADGVVMSLMTPATLGPAIGCVRTGATDSGRPPGHVTIACVVPCCLFDTDAARQAGRALVVGYARHPAAASLFGQHGFGTQLSKVVDALDHGDVDAAYGLVDDDMVEDFVLVGDLERCVDRIAAYLDAGVDELILFPLASEGDWDTSVRHTIDIAGNLPSVISNSRRGVLR